MVDLSWKLKCFYHELRFAKHAAAIRDLNAKTQIKFFIRTGLSIMKYYVLFKSSEYSAVMVISIYRLLVDISYRSALRSLQNSKILVEK